MRAIADDPAGPLRRRHRQPLVCQEDEGGSIDASPFRDADGSLYLYWKNDGNCCGLDTWLYGQQLADDGLSLTGEPVRLLGQDADWEGNLIEAPFMWSHDDQLYLFYSGNAFDSATMPSATPPVPARSDRARRRRRTRSSARRRCRGPRSQQRRRARRAPWIVYHAWPPHFFASSDVCTMWISELTWQDGRPVVDGPR